MNTTIGYRAAVLGLTWLGGAAGHETGDYLVQLDSDAQRKQDHTRPDTPSGPEDRRTPCQRVRDGRVSLARHAITYGIAQAVTKAVAYRAAGLRVPLGAQAAGTAAEIVLHAVVDDGRLLARFAAAAGKADHEKKTGFFYSGHAVASGRSLMDQAVHKGVQIPLGAVITTLLAARRGRRR